EVVLALVAFRGYLISGRRRGGAVFVRVAQTVKERVDALGLLKGWRVSMGGWYASMHFVSMH
uniref:hypothetical protein n=1 Tax=Pseudomonas viridiflava TaxID=33069 RepID=UPI00197EAC6A